MAEKRLYKVIFLNQGKVYEIYAKQVTQGGLLGFVEVEDPVFGERTKLVVDPSEERLKTEFEGVKRFYVPVHAVVRIDEVEKEGVARILPRSKDDANVAPFPIPTYNPRGDSGSS